MKKKLKKIILFEILCDRPTQNSIYCNCKKENDFLLTPIYSDTLN